MKKLLDYFYRYSIISDFSISLIICLVIFFVQKYSNLELMPKVYDKSISSDLGAIGLTISGFLITITTILISFKTNSIKKDDELKSNSNSFLVFIASNLYFQTVNFLNKSVIILVLTSLINFIFKIFISDNFLEVLFYTNIITVFIILNSFFRSIYILNLIIKMQK